MAVVTSVSVGAVGATATALIGRGGALLAIAALEDTTAVVEALPLVAAELLEEKPPLPPRFA